jgi:hypothetical protein
MICGSNSCGHMAQSMGGLANMLGGIGAQQSMNNYYSSIQNLAALQSRAIEKEETYKKQNKKLLLLRK